jgi:hypothetical protein
MEYGHFGDMTLISNAIKILERKLITLDPIFNPNPNSPLNPPKNSELTDMLSDQTLLKKIRIHRRTIRFLQNAKSKITPPSNFTRGCIAEDKSGRNCSPNSARAIAWSLEGALRLPYSSIKNLRPFHRALAYDALKTVIQNKSDKNPDLNMKPVPISEFSYVYGHIPSLRIIDDAIMELKHRIFLLETLRIK